MADKLTATEVLARVKQYFTELMAPVPPVVPPVPPAIPLAADPTEYELKDGGKVTIDKLEVGGIVMIDGNPALPGDLNLADGTKLTVGDNGVISAITAATPAPPDPTVEMSNKFTAFETATNEKFAQYETKFSAYEQRFADYEVKMKKANKVIEELLNLSQLIVEAPAAPPDSGVRKPGSFNEAKKEGQYTPILFGE